MFTVREDERDRMNKECDAYIWEGHVRITDAKDLLKFDGESANMKRALNSAFDFAIVCGAILKNYPEPPFDPAMNDLMTDQEEGS